MTELNRTYFLGEFKKMHSINPLGMRVLVKIIKEQDTTKSGLYLPEGAKQAMCESILAEVISVASAMDEDTDEETNISGLPLGATVLIKKDEGITVPWDDNLRIVETTEVLAIVEQIEYS